MKKYDVIVIGGGSAGFSVLEQISHQGLRIAVVENRKLGGSCPNFACVPTKALVKAAHELYMAKRASEFGILVHNISFDWEAVQDYRAKMVAQTAAQESEEDLKEKEVDLIWGTAKFLSPNEIEVGGKVYQASKFAITTGSRAAIPDVAGIDEVSVLDSDKAVELKTLPKSLTVVGSGPVGIELAQVFARFGVKVVVLTHGERILTREEPEVAELAKSYLEKDGVEFIFNAEMKGFVQKGTQKEIHIDISGKHQIVKSQEVLAAIGRTPNIDMLNLEKAGVDYSEKGIKTNEYMQSSKPHIYAAGDDVGIMLFTHNASYEGYIIGRNLLGDLPAGRQGKLIADHRVIPRGTFSDPEIGSVGVMEDEARKKSLPAGRQGFNVQTATMPYGGGRGSIESAPDGLIKVTVDGKTRQILGASVLGSHAAEFIHFIALAMHKNIPVDDLDTMVYAFPTYAEGIAGITEYLKEV